MTDYHEIATQWVTEPHRADVEVIAHHLHANESIHLHDGVGSKAPCSYCWLRAAKAVQGIERAERVVVDAAEMKRLQSEIEDLRESERKLNALESAGVDNWDGYSYAMELLNEGEASC